MTSTARHGGSIGAAAVGRLVAHFVHARGFHRLVIDPAADSAAATACSRTLGIRPVGVMRRPGGTWHDGPRMDLRADELTPGAASEVVW